MGGRERFVGIVGSDFCGSTLLAKLLNTVPGVASGGELHWLRDAPVDGSVKTRAGWHISAGCSVCGPQCTVFTREFAIKARKSSDLYETVAQRLKCDTLVISDKSPHIYKQLIGPGRMTGIVLFKPPQRAAASFMRHENMQLSSALHRWVEENFDFLTNHESYFKRKIFVSYDRLVLDPVRVVGQICQRLCIPFMQNSFSLYVNGYHSVGGSPHSHHRLDLTLDDRWKDVIPEEKWCRLNNELVAELYGRLMGMAL